MAPNSTRDALLQLLSEMRVADSADLAKCLALTPSAVRYHLAMLSKEGKIEPIQPASETSARGRPLRRYRLPPRRLPGRLPELCATLLQARRQTGVPDWGIIAAGLLPLGCDPEKYPAVSKRRLDMAATTLTEMGYDARWEAGPHGPVLRLRACPYAAVWEQCPEICALDQALLSQLTGNTCRQVQRMSFVLPAPVSCLFEVTLQQP